MTLPPQILNLACDQCGAGMVLLRAQKVWTCTICGNSTNVERAEKRVGQ